MIPPLDPTKFEDGLKAYLDARFEAAEVEVPTVTGENTVTMGAPLVVPGLSTVPVGISTVSIAVKASIGETLAAGWYEVEPMIVVVTPLKIDGITRAHHQAVYEAITDCFPGRPQPGAASEDIAAWEALHEELSDALEAACGYRAGGWFTRSSIYGVRGDRIEQPFVVRIGAVHGEV